MSLSLSSATTTTSGFNPGGSFNVGTSRNLGLSGGKPFQTGYGSVAATPMRSGKANKPMHPFNYRVVRPFNVAEYKAPGREWHKNLDAQYAFIVRNDEQQAVKNFSKSLQPLSQPLQKRQATGKVGIDEITPIRTLPALNYGLMLDCYKSPDMSQLSLRKLLKRITALAISHTPENTTLPYPIGSHVTNFTCAGEVDCYNIFGKKLRELQHLYMIIKPVLHDWNKNKIEFRFSQNEDKQVFESLAAAKGITNESKKYIWQVVAYASEDDLPPHLSDYEISYTEYDEVCRCNITKYVTGTYWKIGVVKEIILTEIVRKGNDWISMFPTKDCSTDFLCIINQPKIRVLVDPFHPPIA